MEFDFFLINNFNTKTAEKYTQLEDQKIRDYLEDLLPKLC